MTFPRNAPSLPGIFIAPKCSNGTGSYFLSKAVDVESQCITFASLPHLWVFGVECREIASIKFLNYIILPQTSYICRRLLAAD